MSDRDREIVKYIKKCFELNECRDNVKRLTNKIISGCMGEDTKTFESGIDNKGDFFNNDRLKRLYNGFKNYNDKNINKLAKEVMNIYLKPSIYSSIESLAEGLDKEERVNLNPGIKLATDKYFSFMSSASIAPIIILSKQSDLSSYLPELFSKGSVIKMINLTVAKESTADTIKVIEEWAYGSDGYAKPLQLKLFEREGEPIAEMVGGFIEGEFIAVMKHEGYTLMSQLGHELLQEESDNLADEQPIWSLPYAPEARLIERLRRELVDILPPDALAYLADKMQTVEDAEYQDTAAEYEDNAAVCNALMASLVMELKDKYGDEVATTVQDTLEYFKLAAV